MIICPLVSMDTWIVGYLKLFSICILGYLGILAVLDSWIFQLLQYPDTWLAKNAWISMYPGCFGQLDISTFVVSGYLVSQKCLDIHVSGCLTIRIRHLQGYSTIVYPIKMKYGSQNNIFGLKMMEKRGLEIFILKSIHAQTLFLTL